MSEVVGVRGFINTVRNDIDTEVSETMAGYLFSVANSHVEGWTKVKTERDFRFIAEGIANLIYVESMIQNDSDMVGLPMRSMASMLGTFMGTLMQMQGEAPDEDELTIWVSQIMDHVVEITQEIWG